MESRYRDLDGYCGVTRQVSEILIMAAQSLRYTHTRRNGSYNGQRARRSEKSAQRILAESLCPTDA